MKLLAIFALVAILIATALAAEDGVKVILKFKLSEKLTDEQLDSDPFWGFNGSFLPQIAPKVSTIIPGLDLDADSAEWHTNKREVHLYTYFTYADRKKFDTYDDLYTSANRKLVIDSINSTIPQEARFTLIEDTEIVDEKFKEKCFKLGPNDFDDDCYLSKPGEQCTEDDDCVYFSICDFNSTPPHRCTDNTHCESLEDEKICNVDGGICVQCLAHSDCTTGECVNNKCSTVDPLVSSFSPLDDKIGACSQRSAINAAISTSTLLLAALLAVIASVITLVA